jgi:hypothetical protein
MSDFSIFDHKPPLSLLTAPELLGLARELEKMAQTAPTPEVRDALDAAVVMCVVRAAQRELEERRATRH